MWAHKKGGPSSESPFTGINTHISHGNQLKALYNIHELVSKIEDLLDQSWSSVQVALEALLGLLPFKLRINNEARLNTDLRHLTIGEKAYNVRHSLIVDKILKDLLLDMTPGVMMTEYTFIHPYTLMLDSNTGWKEVLEESS